MSDRKFMLMKNVFQARRHSRWILRGCVCVWVCKCAEYLCVCVGCHCVCVRGIFMTWPENEIGLCKKTARAHAVRVWKQCNNNNNINSKHSNSNNNNQNKTTVNSYSLWQQRTQPIEMPTTLPLKALTHSYLTHLIALIRSHALTQPHPHPKHHIAARSLCHSKLTLSSSQCKLRS